jgi:hypothetical protein
MKNPPSQALPSACRFAYDYVYHYDKLEVLGRTFVSKGQLISVYLCAGEDHCMAGALYTR